jgi:hypothetical protein
VTAGAAELALLPWACACTRRSPPPASDVPTGWPAAEPCLPLLLQDAIEAKRGERASEQAQLQALIDEGSAGGVSPYDRPDVPPAVKVGHWPAGRPAALTQLAAPHALSSTSVACTLSCITNKD